MTKEWIEAAQKGDTEAFLALLQMHDRQVMSVVYRFAGCMADREDLYQDIFIHVFQSIKKYQFRASFRTWLYRVALNRCYSYLRSRKSFEVLEDQGGNPLDFESRAKIQAVHQALAKLRGPQRISFHLFYVESWSVEEIAEVLHCQVGTVKAHLQRARSKIKSAREVRTWLANPI